MKDSLQTGYVPETQKLHTKNYVNKLLPLTQKMGYLCTIE